VFNCFTDGGGVQQGAAGRRLPVRSRRRPVSQRDGGSMLRQMFAALFVFLSTSNGLEGKKDENESHRFFQTGLFFIFILIKSFIKKQDVFIFSV